MTWRHGLRIGIAVAGVIFAGVLYMLFGRRPIPVVQRPPGAQTDPAASTQATGLIQIMFSGGREGGSIRAEKALNYPDGRSRFENLTIISPRGDRRFEVRADSAEGMSTGPSGSLPREVVLKGNVRVDASDGFQLRTEEAAYTDATGEVRIPGAFSFVRGRISGNGVGGTYDRHTELLWMFDRSQVDMAADPSGGGVIHATAQKISLDRNTKNLRLETQAVIHRDTDTLTGDIIIAYLTPDEQSVQRVELRGRAAVAQSGGSSSGPPELRATDINLDIRPENRTVRQAVLMKNASIGIAAAGGRQRIAAGFIDAIVANDGSKLSRLDAREGVTTTIPGATADAPGRVITALALLAEGNDAQGLRSATFSGGVIFRETQAKTRTRDASLRTAGSRTLELDLDGNLGAIDEARFKDDAVFKSDDKAEAHAAEAKYTLKEGMLRLRGATPSSTTPYVINADGRVYGVAMNLNIETQDMLAEGAVSTNFQTVGPRGRGGAAGAPGTMPAVFDADKPVLGSADQVNYDGQKRVVTYTGNAKVWQSGAAGEVQGEIITLDNQLGNLTATGTATVDAHSKFVMSDDAGRGGRGSAPRLTEGWGKTMEYKEAERKVVYTKGTTQAHVKSPDGDIFGDRIELALKAGDRVLGRMLVTGTVKATIDATRYVTGDRLSYDAVADMYVVAGTPVRLIELKTSSAGDQCTETAGVSFKYNRKTGQHDVDGEAGLSSRSRPLPACPAVLKK